MHGYKQIRATTTKSKSIDFADLSSPHHRSKTASNQYPPNPNPNFPTPKIQSIKTHKKTQAVFAEQDEGEEQEQEQEEDEIGQRFGVVLSRTYSVSSATRVRAENPSLIHSTVKRAFSMRKSASVSEGYCRIHDQRYQLSPIPDVTNRQPGKTGRFLKACKRFFGFTSK